MGLTFDGYTITGGISPIFGSTDGSHGDLAGTRCTLKNQAGVGASWDPFSFDIPCDCQPQAGDTIRVTARTVLFFDVSTIEWDLCGHKCIGSKTEPGFSLGLEIKSLKWVV